MFTQNFGAAASFQAFGSFGAQALQQGHCSCATQPPQTYPGYPAQAPQQSMVSAQFEIQMMMSYYMTMMSSMSQLQQGFGSFAGQQPSPYQLPIGGGYAQVSSQPAYQPAPAPHVAPAPAPPAKKGGYH